MQTAPFKRKGIERRKLKKGNVYKNDGPGDFDCYLYPGICRFIGGGVAKVQKEVLCAG